VEWTDPLWDCDPPPLVVLLDCDPLFGPPWGAPETALVPDPAGPDMWVDAAQAVTSGKHRIRMENNRAWIAVMAESSLGSLNHDATSPQILASPQRALKRRSCDKRCHDEEVFKPLSAKKWAL
jgi:hypothetical protein